ncbi:MAG TPA: hypothetical protein VHQ69_13580 [Methylomirabilota bacterium]|nr:hypothetical protein [Methylomirabilota bacterium]
MKQGPDLDRFHATTDKQVNRNAVVRVLSTRENWRLAAVVIEKSKVYPEFGEPHHFYPQFAGSVLKYVFHRHVADGTDSILVLTDTLPVQRFRDAVEKALKLCSL